MHAVAARHTAAPRRPPRSGAFPALVLLASLLAGCSQAPEPDPPTSAECIEQGLILDPDAEGGPRCTEPPFEVRGFEDPDHHCVATKQRDRVHAPDLAGDPWVRGQYWDYALDIDGAPRGTTRLVYYEDQDFARGTPQHYMVGTATREDALRHALFSENPMIGRVHRILYSPHESGEHADMFHFPLCTGSTWQTVFYGETFRLTAQAALLDVPGGNDDGFVIEGSAPSGSTLRLSYSPAAQWFTFIDLDRAGGGKVDLRLVGLGQGHRGDVSFLRGQEDASWSPDGPVAGIRETAFVRDEGAEGPYDTLGLAVGLTATGDGLYRVELLDPDGTTRWEAELGSLGDAAVAAMEEIPFQAGTWILREVSVPPLSVEPTGTLDLVSIYDRSGAV